MESKNLSHPCFVLSTNKYKWNQEGCDIDPCALDSGPRSPKLYFSINFNVSMRLNNLFSFLEIISIAAKFSELF